MASLHVFVCLLGLVVLSHSDNSCFFKELEVKDPANPPKGCLDMDGKLHDFGSKWERDCMACSCASDGLSCCRNFPDADTVDVPEECELVINKATCTAKVVLKSDKTKECNPL
ncbi:beta-microseminoprotein [Stegastes partitus]|uniref:Beta-microseminoprotein n=1 Tax=Stegastes partitus TaxID=144197 RepID=A0A3B4ZIG8_9TELE|nr:PREDICTED: beta-microseminoprotein [Stegastes partitus]